MHNLLQFCTVVDEEKEYMQFTYLCDAEYESLTCVYIINDGINKI